MNYLKKAVSGILILVAGIFLLNGCGAGGSTLKKTPSLVRIISPVSYTQPDGSKNIPLTIYVFSDDGDAVSGAKVSISSDPQIGQFDAITKTTDSDGRVIFYYHVPDYQEASGVNSVKITASVIGSNVSSTFTINFEISLKSIVAIVPDDYKITIADGKTEVPITVYAFGSDGKPMDNIKVYASANPEAGNFDKKVAETDENGMVVFKYTVPSKDSMKKLSKNMVVLNFKGYDKYGDVIEDNSTLVFSNVSIGNGLPAAILIKSDPSTIFTSSLASGPKFSEVTAEVIDSAGNPIKSGYKIKFSLLQSPYDSFLVPSEADLDNYVASTEVFSGNYPGTIVVKAEVIGYNQVISSSTVVNVVSGQPSSITLLQSGNVLAEDDNGTRTVNVFALVKDADGNAVENGTAVYFSLYDSCGGMIQTQSITSNGIAKASIVYPGKCIWKPYTLHAQTNGGLLETSVSSYYPAVYPVVITLSGPASIGSAGGTVLIYGNIKDEGGKGLPVENAKIVFSSSVDNVTFNPSIAYSDGSGDFLTEVSIPSLDNATTSRTINITAQSGTSIGTLQITQSP